MALMVAPVDVAAQAHLLGRSLQTGEVVSYEIIREGLTVRVEPLGVVLAQGASGHLYGNFATREKSSLLRVRRLNRKALSLASSGSREQSVSRQRILSHELGDVYYLLSGFDLNRSGLSDLAVIDASGTRLRWSIFEEPLKQTGAESKSFVLGVAGDLVDWFVSPEIGVEFAAFRHSSRLSLLRVLTRSATTGVHRIFRAHVSRTFGALFPIRLTSNTKCDPGIAFYSPSRGKLLVFNRRGKLIPLSVSEKRCGGYQVVVDVNSKRAVTSLEVCSDGSYVAAQRDNERRTSADNQLAVGELAVPISAVRRADITRVEAARGEVPVLLPTPVGGDAPTTEPEPTPISTPYPHNSLYLTLIAQQLALRGAPSNSPGSIHVTADCSDAGKVVGQGEFGSGVLLTGIAAGAELYWRDAAVASNSCVGLNLRAVREHVVVPESNAGGLKVVNTASVSLEIDLARDTSITLFRGSTCEIGSEISTITAAGRTSVPLPYGKTTTISYMVSYFNDVTGGCQLVNNRFLQASFTYLTGAAAAPFGENYGTKGDTEQIGNMPPARSSPAWFIKDGKFYIHGGNSATGWGDLNDLWVYDIARQRWTWLSGVTTLNNAGSFGTLGVTAPTNQPPAKAAHKMWLLNDDAVYLFGAYGLSSQNSKSSMADMWLYDLTSSHWAWVHGPSERNSAAVYGPVGERGTSYRPGGSYLSATFVDIDNTIYLYGGNGPRGDLWRWYPAHKQ
jgi:hypothetical protein